jgi:hypothetical protein
MLALLLALPLSQAAPLKVTWSASSAAATVDSVSYAASNLGDGKASSAWFEGVDGSGLNEWVQADLGGEKAVSGFTVWAGWWYTASQWTHYNRPKVLLVEFSDGTSQEFTLQDAYAPQVFELAAARKTTTLKFKVKSDFSSDAYPDTAISEIQIRDNNRPEYAVVRTFGASTIFPPDVDGTYDPKNLQDGIVDTVWCEGNKTGDGVGEWLDFSFTGSQSISRIQLRNGNAYNFGVYMKSNRGTQVTLTFGDGSKETLAVKDSPAEQVLTFPARTTDKVRLSFDTVKKGSEYNDLCVAEAYFLP